MYMYMYVYLNRAVYGFLSLYLCLEREHLLLREAKLFLEVLPSSTAPAADVNTGTCTSHVTFDLVYMYVAG